MFFRIAVTLLVGLSISDAVQAQQSGPVRCLESIEPAGCLLDLAKSKAFSIKDKTEKANAVAKVIDTNAYLKRADFDLLTRTEGLLNDKKLSLEGYLNLQTALSSYFGNFDANRAQKHARNSVEVYVAALKNDSPKDRYTIANWACGLIDANANVWKQSIYITAMTCTPGRISKIDFTNEGGEAIAAFTQMNAAWVQSDFEEMIRQRKLLEMALQKDEQVGIKTKNKLLNEITQQLKVIVLLAHSELNRRSSNMNEASSLLAQAQEALTGLEKLNDSSRAMQARVMLANYFNTFLDFEKSLATLEAVNTKLESKRYEKSIEADAYIDYLTVLAKAIDRGGVKTIAEAKERRHELQMRQADVLYSRYKWFADADKDSNSPSKETMRALIDAAEAGNPYAMHNLGFGFEHGLRGQEKNLQKARYWYYWSAVNGFAGAQNNLGDLYEKGDGTPVDIGMAIYWYTQAAMQGEPTAYLSLGELFLEGKGIERNYFTSAFWLSLAARSLPEGQNKADAIKGRDLSVSKLDEKARRQLASRLYSFIPLKQTDHTLTDRPKLGEDL